MVVVGGSRDLALAPGFAAIAQIRSVSAACERVKRSLFVACWTALGILQGVDQSCVFLSPKANPETLRSKYAAVLVRPTFDFNQIERAIGKCHGIVVGPGFKGDKTVELQLVKTTAI